MNTEATPTVEQRRITTLQYCLGITKEALVEERHKLAQLHQIINNFADEAVLDDMTLDEQEAALKHMTNEADNWR